MPRTSSARLHIGIGGWNFKPWRGAFYPAGLPQKKELAYAASRLTSIEINSTFYGSQKPASFARWREQAPPGFVFSVKGPMFATQRGNLAAAGTSINRFFSGGVLELREKLGPVNWQLAPAKKFDAEEIEAFFALLPKKVEGRAIRHAIEVRHESFCDPALLAGMASPSCWRGIPATRRSSMTKRPSSTRASWAPPGAARPVMHRATWIAGPRASRHGPGMDARCSCT